MVIVLFAIDHILKDNFEIVSSYGNGSYPGSRLAIQVGRKFVLYG